MCVYLEHISFSFLMVSDLNTFANWLRSSFIYLACLQVLREFDFVEH